MRRAFGIIAGVVFATTLSMRVSHAETASCAKAKVLSGTSCKDLQVSFDLSGCGGDAGGHADVSCTSSGATASIKASGFHYQASLKQGAESWGVRPWVVAGTVNRKRLAGETAQAAPESSTAPRAPATESDGGVTFGGLVDLYYAHNFNRPRPVTLPNSTGNGTGSVPAGQNGNRNFDTYQNQFGLNLVELAIRKTGKEVGMKLDLDFGVMADFTHKAGDATTVDEVSKHIGQAVVSYNPSGMPNLTIQAGKMPTHVGYEVTKAKDNWQYSRSFLYALAIPYWHTGVNVAYNWGNMTTGLYVYNGWNTIYDNNNAKTVGAQVGLTPVEGLAVTYNAITGAEQAGANGNAKTVHDLNAVWTASPSLAFATDVAVGRENNVGLTEMDPTWTAGTLATKITLGDVYSISPRIGFYSDSMSYTTGGTFGTRQSLTELTLTNAWALSPGLETRLELRRDSATEPLFATHEGPGMSKVQSIVTAALLYSF